LLGLVKVLYSLSLWTQWVATIFFVGSGLGSCFAQDYGGAVAGDRVLAVEACWFNRLTQQIDEIVSAGRAQAFSSRQAL
jgi:hypothetical protein